MLASLEWLKQYVDINIPVDVLVDKITRAGLEVETVTNLGEGLEGVLTGKVTQIERHPDSDHLWVCQMDYGQGIVQILTGAQNVKQNDIVPVAVVGSTLPFNGDKLYIPSGFFAFFYIFKGKDVVGGGQNFAGYVKMVGYCLFPCSCKG